MRDPVISIVMPTYDNADMIENAVNSLRAQTFPDFELIIVADGNGDETSAVLAEIKDYRLIYHIIEHGNDYGIAALNYGCQMARGQYLTMCSSDNMYFSGFLKTLLEDLDSSNVDFSYGDFLIFDKLKGTAQEILRPIFLRGDFSIEHLAYGYVMGICFLYKRELYKKFGPYRLSVNSDYDMVARMAMGGVSFHHIPTLLGLNVVHPKQTSETSRIDKEETRIRLMVCEHLIKEGHLGGKEIKKLVLRNQELRDMLKSGGKIS